MGKVATLLAAHEAELEAAGCHVRAIADEDALCDFAAGKVGAWFEEDDSVPFMMKVTPIRTDKRGLIPAVTGKRN